VLTLLATLSLSIPGLYLFGFPGPAIGTALAFIPMLLIYCFYISRALALPMSDTFPLLGYLRVVGLTAVAAAPAIACKLLLHLPPAAMFALIAVVLLGTFLALGLASGLITREDLQYARRFVRFGR
jgi:hypothetical protein